MAWERQKAKLSVKTFRSKLRDPKPYTISINPKFRTGGGGIYGPAVPNPTLAYETDTEAQQMLWRTSEEATGIKFTL